MSEQIPFYSYLTPVLEDLVAWKHLWVVLSYKDPACERSLPHQQRSSIRSCSAPWSGTRLTQSTRANRTWGASGAPGHDHSLSPLWITHPYTSPHGHRRKGRVNPGTPPPLLLSLTAGEDENRVVNPEFLPGDGWGTWDAPASSCPQAGWVWRHGLSVCLQGACWSAAWLPEHAGGEVGAI